MVLFDNVSGEDKSIINKYFINGRHYNQSCFFISQSYGAVNKNSAKDNANYLVIFRQDELSLLNLYKNHVIGDMTFRQFLDMCAFAWNTNEYGFLVIDKEFGLTNGRYKVGFNDHIIL